MKQVTDELNWNTNEIENIHLQAAKMAAINITTMTPAQTPIMMIVVSSIPPLSTTGAGVSGAATVAFSGELVTSTGEDEVRAGVGNDGWEEDTLGTTILFVVDAGLDVDDVLALVDEVVVDGVVEVVASTVVEVVASSVVVGASVVITQLSSGIMSWLLVR